MKIPIAQIENMNREIETVISQYKERSAKELAQMFRINMNAKNAFSVLTHKLVEDSENSLLYGLLEEKDFRFKTVRLDKYGRLKESISLPVFKYVDIANETWETSALRAYFYRKAFAFTVFRAEGKELFLNKVVVWQMPEEVLENGVRAVWQRMHDLLMEGNIVKYIDNNGRYFTHFPASADNPYVHVRPHAQDREDALPLPVPDKLTGLVHYTKHSFWLNRSYVLKIITA